MKISRQSDLRESNKITCDWLDEFANNLAKSANLEHLDVGDRFRILSNSTKFSTIDAKMKDIKVRIGFEALMLQHNKQGANNSDAGRNDVKTAQLKHDPSDIRAMSQILTYIIDLVKHEPHLDYSSIISRCRQEDDLYFQDLPINVQVLKDYINSLISKNSSTHEVKYVPQDPITHGDSEDNEADYYQHANTTL